MIAGEARGRKLVAPEGEAVRPTKDMVREAQFSALDARGAIVDAQVLDLYAGSGALGIEALSRGAARATFVERDRDALGREFAPTCKHSVMKPVPPWLPSTPAASSRVHRRGMRPSTLSSPTRRTTRPTRT